VVRLEQLLGAVDGELLGDVDVLATAVVALAGIAFRVLVREHGPLRLEHPRARVVLRCDELDVLLLTAALPLEGLVQLRIEARDIHRLSEHVGEGLGWRNGPRIVPARRTIWGFAAQAAGSDEARRAPAARPVHRSLVAAQSYAATCPPDLIAARRLSRKAVPGFVQELEERGDDCVPALCEVGAVVAAAAEGEDAAVTEPFGERHEVPRCAAVSGGRVPQV